jgi:dTDP-4-dehydrorhamnose reductase
MLGSAIFRRLSASSNIDVYGAVRKESEGKIFTPNLRSRLLSGVEAINPESIRNLLNQLLPNIVINCIAINHIGKTQVEIHGAYQVNALLPHSLAEHCKSIGARFIHISTDGVFSGTKGGYTELDTPDPIDEYGVQKLKGEVLNENCITLRTSMIGHSLDGASGLVDWFLNQKTSCKAYTNALFSGLTTYEIANVIQDIIITDTSLSGLYHLSADPISKYEILKLIASEYEKKIELIADGSYIINRTLDSSKFKLLTSYQSPGWDQLIKQMKISHQHYK